MGPDQRDNWVGLGLQAHEALLRHHACLWRRSARKLERFPVLDPSWSTRWRCSDSRCLITPRARFVLPSRPAVVPSFGPARFGRRSCDQSLCRPGLRTAQDRHASHEAPEARTFAARARYALYPLSRASRARFSSRWQHSALRGLLHRSASAHGLGGGLRGRSRCARGLHPSSR